MSPDVECGFTREGLAMPIIEGIKKFIVQKAKETEFDLETGNFSDLEIRQGNKARLLLLLRHS